MNALEASGNSEGGDSNDLTGKNKSRLKSFKSRLFGKIRRKEDDSGLKQSQSESDITLGVEGSEDDQFSQGTIGSRTFSHDSIFLAEHSHTDLEPPRVLSQENIHGKIRALQMKLQQQKMHLCPPPLLLPMKRPEDFAGSSEDDGLPRSPPEMLCGEGSKSISKKFPIPPKNHSTLSLAGTGSEEEEQDSSWPLSPRPVSPSPAPLSRFSTSSVVDFNAPPQFTSLLDNSAAHHRMSIKPKNQRASTKKRLITSTESRPRSDSLNKLECSLTERVEDKGLPLVKEIRARSYSSQVLRPGERLTTSHIKSTLPVSPVMSLQSTGDSKQTENDNEISILSTSPQSLNLKELTPIASLASTTGQESKKESKCFPKSDQAQAAKPPIPLVPIDQKASEVLNSSKLLKNNQSNLVSTVNPTVRPSVTTIQEPNVMQDDKFYAVIQNKIDSLSNCGVQNAVNVEKCQSKDQYLASTQSSDNVICGVSLRPSSLMRNAPSIDEKHESKTLQPVTTVLAVGQEDHSQTKSTKQQRSVSGSFHFTVSSDKNRERPRTASFTGVVGQAGQTKEPPSPAKPPLNLKMQCQIIPQAEKRRQEQCADIPPESKTEEIAAPNPAIPITFTNLPVNSQARDVEESQDNEMQEIGVEAMEVEVQEEVEEAEEAGEDVTDVEDGKEREATNAFGVKLRYTSLSLRFRSDKAQKDRVKPLASQSDSTSCKEPENQHTSKGYIRVDTKLKNPPPQNKEHFTSTSVVSSSSPPKSVSRDQERGGYFHRQPVSEPPQSSPSPSKATKIVPSLPKEIIDLPPKENTAVSSKENTPTSTASEVSWMEMAREKTRSLQQLFTSRLPEFPGLQTTMRPTTLDTTTPQTQTSTTQANAIITQNIISQQIATQPSMKQTEVTTVPSLQPSGRSTQPATQFPPLPAHTRTSTNQPSTICTNPTQTATSQSQIDSTRELMFQSKTQICNSTTKTAQSTVTCTSNKQSTTLTANTVKQLSSTLWTPPTPPIQQSSSLRTGPVQTPKTPVQSTSPTPLLAYPHLSSSPKLTSHLFPQQSANTVSQDQPQNDGVISGKDDRVSEPQDKGNGLGDGRPTWAAGLGNKTALVQRWENQTTAATKAGEQKATTDSRTTPQSTVPLRHISRVTGTDTGLDPRAPVSSVQMRSAEREDKWQKKSVPPSSSPSSSPPLQSGLDSSQPSWMEMAKRKSLAWSDKTMD
ncbi:proteoglycan 4-like [Xyrauchen texanus]|uniref:proteoglycan 4-like n=1 Tax=Xyrauchen texanus TaxID=154827 RepID=UPI0022429711|nr:proteoglycan 4-like [Xyrauchen texanus]XP_052003768.1 proteoglycan 4-like [Xyrauchen texanus]XP_052003769.1 proteoglycan 4-like [Xyrauchen texanus]